MPWKIAAGLLSMLLLGGLVVTSLNRGPNDVWTIITAGVALLIAVLVVRALSQRRRHR